ncbi:MAG: hypothetical protein JJV96_00965 [Alphaproteobacteria bacterium]|nr:hypothetical protein [Alphaproteobacteria bacterium]
MIWGKINNFILFMLVILLSSPAISSTLITNSLATVGGYFWGTELLFNFLVVMGKIVHLVFVKLGYIFIYIITLYMVVLFFWGHLKSMFKSLSTGDIKPPFDGKVLDRLLRTNIFRGAIVIAIFSLPSVSFISKTFLEPISSLGIFLQTKGNFIENNKKDGYVVSDFHTCVLHYQTMQQVSSPMVLSTNDLQEDTSIFSSTFVSHSSCQLEILNKSTEFGLTLGSLLIKDSFDKDFRPYSLLPILPSFRILLLGLLTLFIFSILFLPPFVLTFSIFIDLCWSLVFLPFSLLNWIFKDDTNNFFKFSEENLKEIVEKFARNMLGLTVSFFGMTLIYIWTANLLTLGDSSTLEAISASINGQSSRPLLELMNTDISLIGYLLGFMVMGYFSIYFYTKFIPTFLSVDVGNNYDVKYKDMIDKSIASIKKQTGFNFKGAINSGGLFIRNRYTKIADKIRGSK